jgi:trehalose 6-phosphate phosphatase
VTEPLLPVHDAVRTRLAGAPLVVMLDVDGTLAPIAPRPELAQVPATTSQCVAALAAGAHVIVALVSGRAAADARRLVRVANTWVIGNHGYEIVSPDGESLVDPQVEPYRNLVAQAGRRLEPRLAHVAGVIVEDKRWTLSVHYRLADPAVVPRVRGLVEDTAQALGLHITDGKMVFEIRPPARVDKGTAVLTLAARLHALGEGASLVFIGDDRTDEDAFRALRLRQRNSVTVRVAPDENTGTAAEFAVADPEEVLRFLEWLRAERGAAPRRAAGGLSG